MTFSSLSPRSTSRSAGGLCLSLRLLACLCRAGDRALLFCAAGAGVFFVAGLCDALWLSPPDYQQGETVRILYIHAPAAWMGMALYAAMSFAAAATLVLRNALADLFCTAAAPVGLVLTGLCLATGSIWGRPTWGAWWAWDARLTSMLVLFLLYASFLALRRLPFAARTQHDAARAGALLLLAGFADLPVVKYSVEWWNTLHQPASLLRSGGAAIDSAMLRPLALMASAFAFYTAALVLLRMRTLFLSRRLARLRRP